MLFALCLVVVGLPAPAVARAPEQIPLPIDRRVFVLGDSVILGAQNQVAFRLSFTGWQATLYAAESLHSYNVGPVIDASRPGFGEIVVVALGHNDEGTPGQFTAWVDDVMAHLRDVRQVFWVNLRNFREWVPAANADLEAATQRWPNLRIIDWDARSSPDPGLVVADGIHPTSAGQLALADLIGAALDTYALERAIGDVLRPLDFF